MGVTINGDVKSVKERMKTKHAETLREINRVEKELKKSSEHSTVYSINKSHMEKLVATVPIYSVSNTLPVTYGGMVINGKLLQDFIKKLKGMHYEISSDDVSLQLRYEKRPGDRTGLLELYNLNDYFEDFEGIPELVISE